MPIRYYVDSDQDVLVARVTGAITAEEIIDAFNRFVQETQGAALFLHHAFVMHQNVSPHNLGWEALVRMKENLEAWGQKYPGRNVKTALVVLDSSGSPVAKMWQALTDAYPLVGSRVAVFRDEASAIDWLKS